MEYKDKQIQIIETAEKLFAQKGFAGTSVRDIAEEAGVNLAMISYYFGSKEKLMQALFEHRSVNIRMRVETLLKDESLSPLEKVELLVDDYMDRSFQREPFYKIMICEQLMEKNHFIIEMLGDVKKKNAEIVAELITDGQRKGVFKKDVDVILLLNTMIGTITQMLISRPYYREYHNLQNVPDEKFQNEFKEKLSKHIKSLFKAMLVYEG
jgi:AcrR family transcriptional regulator